MDSAIRTKLWYTFSEQTRDILRSIYGQAFITSKPLAIEKLIIEYKPALVELYMKNMGMVPGFAISEDEYVRTSFKLYAKILQNSEVKDPWNQQLDLKLLTDKQIITLLGGKPYYSLREELVTAADELLANGGFFIPTGEKLGYFYSPGKFSIIDIETLYDAVEYSAINIAGFKVELDTEEISQLVSILTHYKYDNMKALIHKISNYSYKTFKSTSLIEECLKGIIDVADIAKIINEYCPVKIAKVLEMTDYESAVLFQDGDRLIRTDLDWFVEAEYTVTGTIVNVFNDDSGNIHVDYTCIDPDGSTSVRVLTLDYSTLTPCSDIKLNTANGICIPSIRGPEHFILKTNGNLHPLPSIIQSFNLPKVNRDDLMKELAALPEDVPTHTIRSLMKKLRSSSLDMDDLKEKVAEIRSSYPYSSIDVSDLESLERKERKNESYYLKSQSMIHCGPTLHDIRSLIQYHYTVETFTKHSMDTLVTEQNGNVKFLCHLEGNRYLVLSYKRESLYIHDFDRYHKDVIVKLDFKYNKCFKLSSRYVGFYDSNRVEIWDLVKKVAIKVFPGFLITSVVVNMINDIVIQASKYIEVLRPFEDVTQTLRKRPWQIYTCPNIQGSTLYPLHEGFVLVKDSEFTRFSA